MRFCVVVVGFMVTWMSLSQLVLICLRFHATNSFTILFSFRYLKDHCCFYIIFAWFKLCFHSNEEQKTQNYCIHIYFSFYTAAATTTIRKEKKHTSYIVIQQFANMKIYINICRRCGRTCSQKNTHKHTHRERNKDENKVAIKRRVCVCVCVERNSCWL